MVELFEACQQQTSDLDRKEACRARLQGDIQKQFPGLVQMDLIVLVLCRCLFFKIFIKCVFVRVAAVPDRIFYEWTGLPEQRCRPLSCD